jgi:hypothetical protein
MKLVSVKLVAVYSKASSHSPEFQKPSIVGIVPGGACIVEAPPLAMEKGSIAARNMKIRSIIIREARDAFLKCFKLIKFICIFFLSASTRLSSFCLINFRH